MEDEKLNERLCKALGFECYEYKNNGRSVTAWNYPDRFKHLQIGSPAHRLPNLLGLLEDSIELIENRKVYL